MELMTPNQVVLLTRDDHLQGKWLTSLYEALMARGMEAQLLPLSKFTNIEPSWRCLVNRVSDASPASDVMICNAALRAAQLRGVKTINGLPSFSIGTSKMLHHELFNSVGVETPHSIIITSDMTVTHIVDAVETAGMKYPLLLKPNRGGFGKGISTISTKDAFTSKIIEDIFSHDKFAVLQQFIENPLDGFIYRVFFLDKEVQCAVRVKTAGTDGFNACVCSVPFETWDCPPSIANDVKLMAEKSGADCGSVEFMYIVGEHSNGNSLDPKPLYFDFNLLTTLPSKACYDQFAEYILREIQATSDGL